MSRKMGEILVILLFLSLGITLASAGVKPVPAVIVGGIAVCVGLVNQVLGKLEERENAKKRAECQEEKSHRD